jgi:hypothetical protein
VRTLPESLALSAGLLPTALPSTPEIVDVCGPGAIASGGAGWPPDLNDPSSFFEDTP